MPLKNPVSPETIATLVCDAVAEDRFLVLTTRTLVNERVQARAADYDAFIDDMIGSLATPPNLHQAVVHIWSIFTGQRPEDRRKYGG